MKDLNAFESDSESFLKISRGAAIRAMTAMAGCVHLSPEAALADETWNLSSEDEEFLDELESRGRLFFREQGSERKGQVMDRARFDLAGARDSRRMSSIAATGFGLSALCVADRRGYPPQAQIAERARATLDWHLNKLREVHGFSITLTTLRAGNELGNVNSRRSMQPCCCAAFSPRVHPSTDAKIQSLAAQIYERVDWPWMLNGGQAFAMGWHPETGILQSRWSRYCESMMICLLAIGSPSLPVSPELWNSFSRPMVQYEGHSYISGKDPIFTCQFWHAWFDFRGRRDPYTNCFENSVIATRAHRAFCLSYPNWYSNEYWGVSASDSEQGQVE